MHNQLKGGKERMALEWWADETRVIARRQMGKHYIRFLATNIRIERSHQYAKVSILFDNHTLDFDDLAFGKRETRTRLIRSAHKKFTKLPLEKPDYTEDTAEDDMLTFCDQAYDYWSNAVEVTRTEPVEYDPIDFIAKPFVLGGESGTILFASPGTGKSWFSLLLAVSIDSGKKGVIVPNRQANVLYINLERSERSLRRRLLMVNKALVLPFNRSLMFLHGRGKTLPSMASSIKTIIEKEGIEVVILDSLSRSGASLIDDVQVNKTMDTLNSFGISWLAIAHTSKSQPGQAHNKTVFGSVLQDAASDSVFRLDGVSEGDVMFQKLTLTKSNDFNISAPLAYRWVFETKTTSEGEESAEIIGLYHIDPSEFPEPEEVEEKKQTQSELTKDQLNYIWHEGSVTSTQFAEHFDRSESWASKKLTSSLLLSSEQDGRYKRYSVRGEDDI